VRVVICHSCKRIVQVGGDLEEVSQLLGAQESFPCITALCSGRMLSGNYAEYGYPISEVPLRGFYRAINGFGTGTGDPASLKRLREVLLTKRVVDLKAESVGQPERVIIRELVLEDGTRLHFETSAKGACIYYIEERGPSCVEVVENELVAETNAEGRDADREEGGRAAEADPRADEVPVDVAGSTDVAAAEQPDSGGVPSVPTSDRVPESGDTGDRGVGDHPRVRV